MTRILAATHFHESVKFRGQAAVGVSAQRSETISNYQLRAALNGVSPLLFQLFETACLVLYVIYYVVGMFMKDQLLTSSGSSWVFSSCFTQLRAFNIVAILALWMFQSTR